MPHWTHKTRVPIQVTPQCDTQTVLPEVAHEEDGTIRYWANVSAGDALWTFFLWSPRQLVPDAESNQMCVGCFMAPEAPDEILVPGFKFDLCVGDRRKAAALVTETPA